jgi:L-asparaginase
MEYIPQTPSSPSLKLQPRLIIHGGAGNITPATLTPERYAEFRTALLTIVRPPQLL